jgi:CO/xanthine dehydrogenase FAD-binding subunit
VSVSLTTRQRALQREPLITGRVPVLGEAAGYIGHPQIRSRGTICGSLAHADPAAELPAVAVALDAEMVAASRSGRRAIPAEQFFVHYLTTSLQPTELLAEARFPAPPVDMAWSVLEVSRRHGDFALVGVVAGLSLDRPSNSISAARLAYFGVHPTPRRARDAERALVGQAPSDDVFRAAGELAAQGLDPDTDIHATVEYRKSVSAVLTVRALRQAMAKIGTA